MIKYSNKKIIEVNDFNKLVEKTYGRPYNFQQQDGCMERQLWSISVPEDPEDFKNDTVPEIVNGKKMGVSFNAWLDRDPKQPVFNQTAEYELSLFWERNFYPNISMVINDLYKRGLIPAGEYEINIDW